jgi:molybdate transport system ATP-binding protein
VIQHGLVADVEVRLGDLHLDVDLRAERDQTLAIVGPNGAGKTTLLRALAGLVPLTAGHVILDGRNVEALDTEQRGIGFVFQDYALFPHMSAVDNVAFGLRCRGVTRHAARSRATEWLTRLGLDQALQQRPAQLSGGQAQRVALARALVIDPPLLLLDEPLAALDATARVETRRDLRSHLSASNGVRVVVTHDPVDAATLADRLMVLEGGKVAQHGTIDEISAHPRSRYVADLVGVNLLRGRATGSTVALDSGGALTIADPAHGDVLVVVHPRAVAVYRRPPEGTPRNVWQARLDALDRHGDRVRVRMVGTIPIVAEVTAAAVSDLALADGGDVWVSVKATELTVLPA